MWLNTVSKCKRKYSHTRFSMFFVFTSMPYLRWLLFVFFHILVGPYYFQPWVLELRSIFKLWSSFNLFPSSIIHTMASEKKLKLQNIPVTDALCIRSKSSSRRTKIMFKNILKLLTQEKLNVPQIWFSEEFATNHLKWTNFRHSLLQMMILFMVFGVHSTCKFFYKFSQKHSIQIESISLQSKFRP